MRKITTLLGLALAIGCGDDDGMSNTDSGTDNTVTMDTTEDTTGEDAGDGGEEMMTIAELAAGNPDLSIVLGLAVRVGLDTALGGDTELTVFAPTNDAFEGIDTDALTDEQVTAILSNHVLVGEVMSDAIPAQLGTIGVADNFAGLTLIFDTSDGVAVNGVPVTTADIDASNGVVHLVESVLLPQNIVDAATNAGLTSLLEAVGAAAEIESGVTVADALSADDELTVLAPTNDAFTAAAGDLEGATAEQVRDVLLYHVVSGEVLAAGLPATAASLLGPDLTFDTAATPPTVNGIDIIATDIKVTNGVVHLIGGVLLPES